MIEENAPTMEVIDDGFSGKRYDEDAFTSAAYELFTEYRNAYIPEWTRMANADRLYRGDHWSLIQDGEGCTGNHEASNAPKPTTPIIFSTIENLKADLNDELPEAVVKPQDGINEVEAKLLTAVIRQELDDCDYSTQYDAMIHDLLVRGWQAQEIGYDPDAHGRWGAGFIRHVPAQNIMPDPNAADIQNGRAVFKFDSRPRHWFSQHYPDEYARMRFDAQTESDDIIEAAAARAVQSSRQENNLLLIEMWYRRYDPDTKLTSIHMAQFAGGRLLANSAETKPSGYFAHGLYPFVISPLYRISGSPLGLGICDMHGNTQLYSDKLDQIIMTNALRASRNRLLVGSSNEDAFSDIQDFSKEIISVPNIADMNWFQDAALPSYIINYVQMMRDSIKTESGSNEQSRGSTGSGVTAASAITALQEMSTKRSRHHANVEQDAFKKAVLMLLDVLSECDIVPRSVTITIAGEPQTIPVSRETFRQTQDGRPIGSRVKVRTARQTRYSKMKNNELALQFIQLLGQTIDPLPILETMDFEDKELMLEKIRASRMTTMMQMQQTIEQMQQQLQQLSEENAAYKKTVSKAQGLIANQQGSKTGAADATASQDAFSGQQTSIPAGLAQNAV